MRVHQTLIFFFFFFLELTGGNSASVHEGTEGGNITVACRFTFFGRRKVFCRNDCKDEDKDILCEAEDVSVQCGRYGVELIHDRFFSTLFHVSITNFTKSDSGSYMCWLDRRGPLDSTQKFEFRVKDAKTTPKPKTTLKPATTPSTSTLTPEQTESSSSGRTTTSSHSPETTTTSSLSPETTTTSSLSPETTTKSEQGPSASATQPPDLLLYLGLGLLILVVILSVFLLVFCRKRARKPQGPPVQTEDAEIQRNNRVHEEIREGPGQHRSPVVEINTVYASATFAKPDGVETTDDYSLVTAAGSHHKAVDDSGKLIYSEVDFSNSQAASRNSAPSGGANEVIYSVPRAEASTENTAAPLYSTLNKR